MWGNIDKQNLRGLHLMASSRAAGSLSSSLNAGITMLRLFVGSEKRDGQDTCKITGDKLAWSSQELRRPICIHRKRNRGGWQDNAGHDCGCK